MRTIRRATAGIALMGATLLLAAPGAGLAQEPATIVTYTDGMAQLLVRVGAPTIDTFAFSEGVRDTTSGTLELRYVAVDGQGTLEITTPNIAGAHAAAPKPPRGAAVIYRKVHGLSGARAACTVAWTDLSATVVSGSFLCPRERMPTGQKARYAVAGTFSARVTPEDGIVVPDPAPMPVYAAGTPVEVAGQTLTVTGGPDIPAVCVVGRAKGVDHGVCSSKQLPVQGTWRAVQLSACVADEGEALRLIDRTGTSRILYGGAADAVLPIGLPGVVRDAAVTTAPFPRVVNPGSCLDGHLVAGTRGPLVVWMPPDGQPPVGWTLDPVALPPTATVPGPEASGAPASPVPGGSFAPAASVTYAGGAADVLIDGAEVLAADDLVLSEGTYLSDGNGVAIVHLAFASGSGTLTIDVPGPDGSFSWEPGAGAANQGVGFSVGDLAADAGLTGCQVEVAPTELGGVEGSYLCTITGGGTGSGAFIANP